MASKKVGKIGAWGWVGIAAVALIAIGYAKMNTVTYFPPAGPLPPGTLPGSATPVSADPNSPYFVG